MDPIALREFLHVLSLEYTSGTRGARILGALPPSNIATGTPPAAAAAATDAATLGDDGGGRGNAPNETETGPAL